MLSTDQATHIHDVPDSSPCEISADGSLTLAQAIDIALCNNPQTRQAWANDRAQAALVGVAKAAYLPSIVVGMSAGREQTTGVGSSSSTVTTGSLSLNYLMFDFGGRAANVDYMRQRLAVLNATNRSTMQNVYLSTVQAYFALQAAQVALDAALVSEKSANESLRAAIGRFNFGIATPLDKLEAQSAVSQATLARVRAEGDLINSRAILANALGLAAPTNVSVATYDMPVAGTLPSSVLEELIPLAKTNRSDLAAAEAQWQASRAAVTQARSQGLPTLTLTAGENWGHNEQSQLLGISGNSKSASIGLTVTAPLFSGFADNYKISAAQAQAESSQYYRDQITQQVSLDVVLAFNNFNTGAQAVAASQDALNSAEQANQAAIGRYKNSVGTMLELLDAQSTLSKARLQLIQAQYNWNLTRYSLAHAIGYMDVNLLARTVPVPPSPGEKH